MLLEEVLEIQEQQGLKNSSHLKILKNISIAYAHLNQPQKSIEYLKKSITVCEENFRENHFTINEHKRLLADVYIQTKQWNEAFSILSEIHTAHHTLWHHPDTQNFSDYDFFDCSKYSALLTQLSICEAQLDKLDVTLKRYWDEAAFMQTQNRPLLALLYLHEAEKIAIDIEDTSKQTEITHQIADIHQRMGHLHFAKELLDPTLDSAQDPAISDHHHQLELLHVSFVKHMLQWHKQLSQSNTHNLSSEYSSDTAQFFIGFQSLLDQAYNHWISKQLGSKHKGHFPSFQSKPALQAHFTELGLADIETTDACKAFEATQPYHLESTPMVGQSWGKVIRALGNLNKHLKISSSGNSDELDHQGLGLFQKLNTSIEIEYPFIQLHPLSFTTLVGKASAPLYRALQNKGVICNTDGCINALHPWFKQLVHNEDTCDTHQTIADCVERAAKGIKKLGKINIPSLQAREVATLLVDQVIQITHTRSGSALKIPALGLIEQAFATTQTWLDTIYEKTSPKLTLLGENIYTPATKLSIPPFFPSATSYKEQVATMLAHVETQLRESMQTQTLSERKGAITGSLIQMRGLLEKAFRDFAARCICLSNKPKRFPLFKTGLLARLFSVKKDELISQLQEANICNTAPDKISLDRDFPKVLQALHGFWDQAIKLIRIRKLIGWTNDLKHNTRIVIDDWEHTDGPNAHFNGQTFRLQAFSEETFADIKAFVEVCQEAEPKADAIASSQTPSGGGSK